MINVLICGICGKMGQNVYNLLATDVDAKTVCGVDLFTDMPLSVPVYKTFNEVSEKVDVVIDFSSPIGLKERLDYVKKANCAIVLASTGYSPDDLKLIEDYTKIIPIFKTGNLSVGINLLCKLVKDASEFLGEKFDVEIIEKHHNLKKDAPSGTALMLADSVNSAFNEEKEYTFGRYGQNCPRQKQEIGIHAIRGGTIVGEHEVIFAGEDEVVTLSHSAQSKRVFASGSIKAGKFMVGKKAGLYDMNDLLKEAFSK